MSSEQTDDLPDTVSVKDFRELLDVVHGLLEFKTATIEKINSMCEINNENLENEAKSWENIEKWAEGAHERINKLTDAVSLLNLRLNTADENPMQESTNGSAT